MARIGYVLLVFAACAPSIELEGRPCDDDGQCLAGFECHPGTEICVPVLVRGCDGEEVGEVCAWDINDGDACAIEGSFLPCADGAEDCAPGCRTCEGGVWSACSESSCVPGEVWSCADCSDDCRERVLGAHPVCQPLSPPRCDYDQCRGEFVDADRDPENGCECLPDGVEICDGVDNDCNGETDEGYEVGVACGVGVCDGGTWECDGAGDRVCSTMPGGSVDVSSWETCDGLDNDCDGDPDDGFPCVLGATESCDYGNGPASGLFHCETPDCTWGRCRPLWWDASWTRRVLIDVVTTSLSAPVTDFPLPVVLSPSVVDYGDFLAGGADIQFVDNDGSTLLPYEIESWEPTGESAIWVHLDALDPAEPKTIAMYYGSSSAATSSPTTVWSGFSAVWHLAEEAAGRDSTGLYIDATGNGHDGDDFTANDDQAGMVGPGQGFGGDGDYIRIASPQFLDDDTSTIEAWVSAESGARWLVPITFSTGTPVDGYQMVVRLDASFDYTLSESNGADVWFYDDALRPVPHWRAVWNNTSGDSTFWVRVPIAGTTSLRMYVGRANAVSASDPKAVFDFYDDFDGVDIDAGTWDVSSSDYTVDGSVLTLRWGTIGLRDALAFNLADDYLVEVRTRFDDTDFNYYSGTAPEISSSQFTTGGNGASDATAFIMRRYGGRELEAWAGSGDTDSYDLANADYLIDTTDGEWKTYTIVARPDRVVYYFGGTSGYSVTGVSWAREIRYLSLGNFNGLDEDIMDTSYRWIRARKAGAMPTTTYGTPLGAGVSSAGTVGLGTAADAAQASIGTAVLTAATSVGWRYLVVVRDDVTGTLYLDGSEAATAAISLSTGGTVADLLIGDLVGIAGSVDEVRVSPDVRTPAWIEGQHAAVRGNLTSIGTVETAP